METVDRETLENEETPEESEDELWRIEKLEREEYLEKLNNWLDEARLWHYSVNAGLPFNTAENGTAENSNQEISNIFANLIQTNLLYLYGETLLLQRFVNNITSRNLTNVSPTTQGPPTPSPSTYQFVIPPVWRRALAKLMDFLIIFSFRMALTIILLETFEPVDMEIYQFDAL